MIPVANLKILIVDDEPLKRIVMEEELVEAGYAVTAVSNPIEAENYVGKCDFDVVLTDLRMPGRDGLTFLRDIKERKPDQAVIVMTAYGTVETAVEAMKLGAFDYLQKPFSTEELLIKLDKLRKFENLASENEALRQQLSLRREDSQLIGRSESIRKVLSRIHGISGTDTSILIEGESGTGKELVAHMIHEASYCSTGPFVAVSCAELPKDLLESELFGHESGAFTGATKKRIGRFEIAQGGTLFLDDVDDIPLDLQVKLLRVLQEKTLDRIGGDNPVRVTARVIAASKKNLLAMVDSGQFREDLYYRLNVVPLYVPPLRERTDDIPPLIDYFIQRLTVKFNRNKITITPRAVAKLQNYRWPGNVRELEHVLERIIALSSHNELDVNDIPELLTCPDNSHIVSFSLANVEVIDLADIVTETENRLIRWALDKSHGNLAKAAEMLDIPRSTLQYKISKLDQTSSTTNPNGS